MSYVMVSWDGNATEGALAALDRGSEPGEIARKIEHAHARRGTGLAGMNLECARWGEALQRLHSGLGAWDSGLVTRRRTRYAVGEEYCYMRYLHILALSFFLAGTGFAQRGGGHGGGGGRGGGGGGHAVSGGGGR